MYKRHDRTGVIKIRIRIPQLSTGLIIPFCKELEMIGHDEKYFFDVSGITNYEPFPMLLCAARIRQFCDERHLSDSEFELRYVDNNSFSYGCHMGFFRSAGFPFGKEPGQAKGSPSYLPLKRINVSDWRQAAIQNGFFLEDVSIIEKESEQLAGILGQNNNELTKLFIYLIREAVRNVPEHASTDEFWICGQYWHNRSGKPAEIAILDEGCGIYHSLCQNHRHREFIHSNEEALYWAIKPGISASFSPERANKGNIHNGNSGYGLFVISEICKLTNGNMTLLSNDNCIRVFQNNISTYETSFRGTALGIRINTDGMDNYQKLINIARKQGEEKARTIKNAFKSASIPSKGLLFT